MSYIAFERFRPNGVTGAPAAENFLGRLEAWMNDAGLGNVGLSMDIQGHGDNAPNVLHLTLTPRRPGAASFAVSLCTWPDGEVDYYLSAGAGQEILNSAVEDRLTADQVLSICEAIAAGALRERRLTLVGKTVGHRATVQYGHTGTYSKSAGLSGLGLDRILPALGLARLEEITYPAWKAL